MKMLDCAVADDEKLARDVLTSYIERDGFCRLVGSFSDGTALYTFLQTTRVDLLLLDIEMPGLGGLDLIRSLKDRPSIVLTTAYSEYAVDAFALSATDYLLKPFSIERFRQAIEKVRALNSRAATVERKFIDVTIDRRKVCIPIDDILFLEAIGNYVKIHLAGNFLVSYGTIRKMLAMLPENKFIQIHRSYVVNLERVLAFSTSSVTMAAGKTLPMGRYFKAAFFSAKHRMGE